MTDRGKECERRDAVNQIRGRERERIHLQMLVHVRPFAGLWHHGKESNKGRQVKV